jgi:rubrerythrin
VSEQINREKLITILQLAYSGERAAGYAYRGHWNSVSDPHEKARIKIIEEEEWHHRRLVGEMLMSLGAGPKKKREVRAIIIGRTLQLMCHLVGWFIPMYGAGKLESGNIVEYETAARYARDCSRSDLIDCLLTMAEVEWEHERYFRERIQHSRWLKLFEIWPEPPAKEMIRNNFGLRRPDAALSKLDSSSQTFQTHES